jgi:hypothetical protein
MRTSLHSTSHEGAAGLLRLRFVSQNFRELQGWRKLPAGLLMIMQCEAISHVTLGVVYCIVRPRAMIMGALILSPVGFSLYLVAGLLLLAEPFRSGVRIARYYDGTFGRIESQSRIESQLPGWLVGWPAKIVPMLLLLRLLRSIDVRDYFPISLVGLAAAWFFARGPGAWRERPYCGALALFFFAGSLGLHRLPELHAKGEFFILGVYSIPGGDSTMYHELLWVTFGLGLIGMGLLDHQFLVRSLPPVPREDGE